MEWSWLWLLRRRSRPAPPYYCQRRSKAPAGGFFLQRAQEVENVLLLLYSQPTETFDDPVCLATAALVGIDRLPQISGASVMEEKDALPYTPKRSRLERIRAGASLRDTVRKTFAHVVDQEIGEQVHRLIGQRGARLG